MAVIVSSSDANNSSSPSSSSNDTNWMQDLVVEKKPEIIEQKNENLSVIEPQKTMETSIITTVPNKETEKPQEPSIKNIYIEADQAAVKEKVEPLIQVNTSTPSPDIKPTSPKAVDLDELFGTTKANPSVDSTIEVKVASVPITTKKENNDNDHHTLQKFMFGLAGSLAIIAGGFFIVRTVFPLTFENNTSPSVDNNTGTIQNLVQTGVEEVHTVAPVKKTLAEVYTDKLKAYASSGQFYHEFGREVKNRNLIRYGLFIHKKSLDLQDEIQKAVVLSGQIDTVSIEAYLAQFDEYMGILEQTVANDPSLQAAVTTFATGSTSQTQDNTDAVIQTSQTDQSSGTQTNNQPTLDQFLNQVSTQSQ